MKKLFVLIMILVCCSLFFVACSYSVTTEKTGSVGVSVFPASDSKAELTPTIAAKQKNITDDAKGLHLITYSKTGEGEVSLSAEKAQAGERITVTATPSNKWKIDRILVDGEELASDVTYFDMPDKDVAVSVVFADKRHVLTCGDHIVPELDLIDGDGDPAYEVLEGERCYFIVDYDGDDCYYEDKDVTCSYYDYETSQALPLTVRKESSGRYSVVAPDRDANLSVTLHDYRTVSLSKIFTSDYGWGIYSEEDYTDQCQVVITAEGQPYTMGAKVKDGTQFRIHLTVPFAYRVLRLSGIASGFTLDRTNNDEFTFRLSDRSEFYEQKDVALGIEIGKVHTVSCGEYTYGTVSANREWVKGEVVHLSVTPLYGYTLTSLRYTTDGEQYENVDNDANDSGAYSFVMPDGDVTVVAEFKDTDTPADYVRGTILIKYQGDESVSADALLESLEFSYGDPVETLAPFGKVYLPKASDYDFAAQKTEEYIYKAVTVTTDPEEVLVSYGYGFVVFGVIRVGEDDFIITFELLE